MKKIVLPIMLATSLGACSTLDLGTAAVDPIIETKIVEKSAFDSLLDVAHICDKASAVKFVEGKINLAIDCRNESAQLTEAKFEAAKTAAKFNAVFGE